MHGQDTKIMVECRIHFCQELAEVAFRLFNLGEPVRTLAPDWRRPIRCVEATFQGGLTGHRMNANRFPLRKPVVSSEVNAFTTATLKNHPGIAGGRAVIFVG